MAKRSKKMVEEVSGGKPFFGVGKGGKEMASMEAARKNVVRVPKAKKPKKKMPK